MLAKMIDKIVSLKETKTFEIGGQTYTDGHLTRILPHVDRPEAISVSGLDGVCKLIRTELEKVGTTIMVQAKSYKSVEVMTTYLPDFSRNILYRAEADAPGIYTGFRSREVALIELRSLFIPNEGTAYLLDLLGRMTDEKSVSTNDNGVTQTVEARQGVALNALVEVKPRVIMASPYMNDPSAIVARAFAELYPGIDYHAQFVPDLCDESGNRAFGLTIFPDDGSTPIVCISAEAPISAAPELLAHELAHVATPEDRDHGEAWQTANRAIGDKYDELLNALIPDDDPGVLVPHEVGDGGLLLMPTRAHIPDPQRDDWKPATCPICGAECWETEIHRQALAAEPGLRAVCTDCGLRGAESIGLVDIKGRIAKEETK